MLRKIPNPITAGRLLKEYVESYLDRKIYIVSKQQDWVLDWVAFYLQTYFREDHHVETRVVSSARHLRNQIIHFNDRYDYLNASQRAFHPSNHLFLTWFHGDPNEAGMRETFAKLQSAMPNIRQVVTSCTDSQRSLIEYGIDEAKINVIPLGIDLNRFIIPTSQQVQESRQRLGIPDDAICIGSFQKDGSGWGEGLDPKLVKGPDVFLETINELSKTNPKIFVLLSGPSRGYVKNGLDKMGVSYRHDYLNDYHEIVSFYWALDMYLITSRIEGGPMAMLESWATNVPLVTTRMGMPADYVKHEVNGMITDVENVEGLVESARKLIEMPTLKAQCCRQALLDVQDLSWKIVADQYFTNLYRDILLK